MGAPENNGHALLSPSGASRWLACTPSARFEEQFPDSSGEAAQEGTLAHDLGENLLRYHFGQITKRKLNPELKRIEADPMYNASMQDYIDGYVAFVAERFAEAQKVTKDAVIAIESKLDLTDYVPEGFGTGDTVIIADGTLEIIDLKYGKGVLVNADNNNQMKLYALGALREFDFMYEIDTVRMTIYQPRLDNVSSFEMKVKELRDWAAYELIPKAKMAFAGEGDFVTGEHCRFCRARNRCKALADENMKLAKYEFAEIPQLTNEEIADILSRAKAFKSWISSIEDYALQQAIDNGVEWPGFKLVEGRSVRTYLDQDKVAQRLLENGWDENVIYTRSLLGITAMEKTLSKKGFAELLDGLVIKPPGKPTLVPESDKRPAWNSTESAINDFKSN